MKLCKKSVRSYGSVHKLQLYEAELPNNVGEWIEQEATRYYDAAAAFFDAVIPRLLNGIEIGNSNMSSGVRIADSANVVTPIRISVSDDSVKTKTVLFGVQISGYGVSFTRETAEAIIDTTSED